MVVERIAELRSIPIRDIIAACAIDATTALVLAGRGAWKRSPVGLAGDRLKSRKSAPGATVSEIVLSALDDWRSESWRAS
jgi:hypothetical protein